MLMRPALLLIGLLCADPALPSDLPKDAGLLPTRLVTLSPTNPSGFVVAVTITNTFDGPVVGRLYVVGSTNRTELSLGAAVVDWSASPPSESGVTAYSAMMMHRYGLGTRFEIEEAGKGTFDAVSRSRFSPTNGIILMIQYLPPNMKEANADWSKVRFLAGEIGQPSGAEPAVSPNGAPAGLPGDSDIDERRDR